MKKNIFDSIVSELDKEKNQTLEDRDVLLRNIKKLRQEKLNILFVGATGAGKSSTINAIFDTEVAKVGYSVDPETATIRKYEIENIILWDTPGLGDTPEKDRKYAVEVVNALKAKDSSGNLLIDEVIVLIDGSNRDMKTVYEVIEKVIVPYVGETSRIIIAINQCDLALKGRYWDYENNQPGEQLTVFLEEKVTSVKNRIMESTGVLTQPIYYSALHRYNISKLLLAMLRCMPERKRFLFADGLNRNPEIWKKNDTAESYNEEIQSEIRGSLSKALNGAAAGAAAGAKVGSLIPIVGSAVGATVGAVLGFWGGLMG